MIATMDGQTRQRQMRPSYRQIDYWTRHGWLRPNTRDGGKGSGYWRDWPDHELAVMDFMHRLVTAGMIAANAAPIARRIAEADDGETSAVTVDIAEGITMTVTIR